MNKTFTLNKGTESYEFTINASGTVLITRISKIGKITSYSMDALSYTAGRDLYFSLINKGFTRR